MNRALVERSAEGAVIGWELATRRVPEHLRPWLRRACGYGEWTEGPSRRREVPVPSVVVIIEMGPPIRVHEGTDPTRSTRHPGGFVAGLDDAVTLTTHDGEQRGIQLELAPAFARRFFGLPMSELSKRVVSLRELLPRAQRTLSERLLDLPDWDARLDVVEQLLSERLGTLPRTTELVRWACERIERTPGMALKELASELGYSAKHVIALFREHVGTTPMQYARVVRFDRLVRLVRAAPGQKWADAALRCGWYDQAHMIRDVKRLLGVPPSRAGALLAGWHEVNSVQSRLEPAG